MAKNTTITTKLREQLLSGVDIRTLWDSGSLVLFDDSAAQPASAGDAEAGTILATITLPADAFEATVTDGVLSKLGTWQVSAAASGTLQHFRLKASGDGTGADQTKSRIDGTIGATAGQFNMVVDSVSVTDGQLITVTSFDIAALAAVT